MSSSPSSDLAGRTFFITGTTSGIGKSTVDALLARGASVVMANRSEERTRPVLDELRARHPGADLSFIRLDLADLASFRHGVEEFNASKRPLDVLINNAGVGAAPGMTKDGFEVTLGTNHVGPFYLTSLLLPRLREAPQGRIVNVASRAHIRVRRLDLDALRRPARGMRERLLMYGVSKLMNVLHASELARRLADTRVTTYSLHPGVVASEVWRHFPRLVVTIAKRFMITNEEGALTTLHCATAPALASVSGRYYDKCRERSASRLGRDAELARELYDRTDRAIANAL